MKQGRFAEARGHLEECIRIGEQHAEEHPDDVDVVGGVADAQVMLAVILTELRQHAQAADLAREGVLRRERLAELAPGDVEGSWKLAMGWRALANILFNVSTNADRRRAVHHIDPELVQEALEAAYRSVEVAEPLDADERHVLERVDGLAQLGRILGATGDWKAALEPLEEAHGELVRIAAEVPHQYEVRSRLASLCQRMALTLMNNERLDEAIERIDEGTEHAEFAMRHSEDFVVRERWKGLLSLGGLLRAEAGGHRRGGGWGATPRHGLSRRPGRPVPSCEHPRALRPAGRGAVSGDPPAGDDGRPAHRGRGWLPTAR